MDDLKTLLKKMEGGRGADMEFKEIKNFFAVTRNLFEVLKEIRKMTDFRPEIGVVLGSGLGGLIDEVEIVEAIPYTAIKSFPRSTVDGHKGEYIFGYLEEKPVVLMSGRVHYYEGYSMEQVVMPVRIMALLGAETILLTNAAGGVNKSFKPGTLMCINDHISSFVPSPLIGPNDVLGERFPDMSSIYNKDLIKKLHECAEKLGIDLKDGVYLQTSGPNYETPAEVRMYSMLGADAVGMSTACEAMALNHMKIKVAGISCITNMATGISDKPLSHEEVKETADRVGKEFRELVKTFISKL